MKGPDLTSTHKPTTEAVLAVLKERPGQWRVDEIEAYLLDRGWTARDRPFGRRQGIEFAVSRLLGVGELERVRPGVVRYAHGRRSTPER